MPRRDLRPVLAAFDEAEFGPGRTLNLRASLPTASEAVARADAWLRQRQVERAGRVLIVTGRGNNSPNGVSAVREAVLAHLHSLRRRGVVSTWREHTPGSLIVELAPIKALLATPARRKERTAPRASEPAALEALSRETRGALRRLALRSLESLGARDPSPFVDSEMLRQLQILTAALPTDPDEDRDRSLRAAIEHALDEIDE